MIFHYTEDMNCRYKEFKNAPDGSFFIHTHDFAKLGPIESNWIVLKNGEASHAYRTGVANVTLFDPFGGLTPWFNLEHSKSVLLKPGPYTEQIIRRLIELYPDLEDLFTTKITKRVLKIKVI